MGMGMKSLKWEGIGTKNLFPQTSSSVVSDPIQRCSEARVVGSSWRSFTV